MEIQGYKNGLRGCGCTKGSADLVAASMNAYANVNFYCSDL